MKNTINFKQLSIALILILLPLIFYAQSQGGEGGDPDQETPRMTEYSELDTVPEIIDCFPLVSIRKVSILNFQTFSHAYIRFDEGLSQDSIISSILFIKKGESSPSVLQMEWSNTFLRIVLDTNQVYYILSINDCNQYTFIRELSTTPKSAEEIIVISENLNEALSEWYSMGENTDLYDVLSEAEGVPPYERYEFLQNFVKNGEPLLDTYAQLESIPRDAFISSSRGANDCQCKVLEIRMLSEVFPTVSDQENPTILPAIMPTTIIRESQRIKLWEAAAFEGPARYQQIWGETKKCNNITETARWGDGGSPLSSALGHASIMFRQVCLQGHWLPGNCSCEQIITVRYKYDAYLSARSNRRAGACFNPPGKNALAVVDDVVMILSARNPNPALPNSSFTVFFSDASVRGIVSTCNRDFQERRLIDLIKIGFVGYAYAKGLPILTKIPVIDQALDALWKEYQKSNFLSLLEGLITNPWVTGSCIQVSTNHGIDTLLTFTLRNQEAIRFTMTAASELMVSGLTAWDATARVMSGFSLSAVLERNNESEPNTYCCTKPAGIFMMSTLHPIQSIQTYRQAVGTHFAFSGLSCCFPVSTVTGQVIIAEERGRMIGREIPNCETVIRSTPNNIGILSENIRAYFSGSNLLIEGLNEDKMYRVTAFSSDGKMIYMNTALGRRVLSIDFSDRNAGLALYLVRIEDGRNSLIKKIVR